MRPAMLYKSDCWAKNIKMLQRMSVTEMRKLIWICGVTREDKINNE